MRGYALLAAVPVAGSPTVESREPLRVNLIGAGYIATVHAEVVIGLAGTKVTAVVDPAVDRAAAVARRCRAAIALSNPIGRGADVPVDVAHVLTPPATHGAVVEPLLKRDIYVVLEKPMAAREEECRALDDAAGTGGALVAVNQDFIWDSAIANLLAYVHRDVIGPLRHVDLLFMPRLRQHATGQLSHWMFRSSLNLLLEQVVQPVARLHALLGSLTVEAMVAKEPRRFDGHAITTIWRVLGRAVRTSLHLAIDLGASSPSWQLRAIGVDGMLECDALPNLHRGYQPTPWIDACDQLVTSFPSGPASTPVREQLPGLRLRSDRARPPCRWLPHQHVRQHPARAWRNRTTMASTMEVAGWSRCWSGSQRLASLRRLAAARCEASRAGLQRAGDRRNWIPRPASGEAVGATGSPNSTSSPVRWPRLHRGWTIGCRLRAH